MARFRVAVLEKGNPQLDVADLCISGRSSFFPHVGECRGAVARYDKAGRDHLQEMTREASVKAVTGAVLE
jgi:hypothetical protein